jgi:4-diphosphocytidyl-2-C-methyl-D-erythritol kinase
MPVSISQTHASPQGAGGSTGITMHAPAKLNLGLRIFPRRPDGFHDIESWFVPVSLHDTLTFRAADALTLEITGLAAGLSIEPEKNLVGRAALALAKAAGMAPNAHIHLHKLIPAGGGLGGGSSDAAAALLGLRRMWNAAVSEDQLLTLASELGSDVPFFIHGQSAVCRGRGEIMDLLPRHHPLFAVLIIPPYGTSTQEVYQAFDQGVNLPAATVMDWAQLAQADAAGINAAIRNDLEIPAFSVTPGLRALRNRVAELCGKPVQMSGSGSTLFILADQPAQAEALAALLQQHLEKEIRLIPVGIE